MVVHGDLSVGSASGILDVPAGEVAASIWSPRLRDDIASLSRGADIADRASDPIEYEFKLSKKLRRQHEHDALSSSSYD
jgi:hypothetical protein